MPFATPEQIGELDIFGKIFEAGNSKFILVQEGETVRVVILNSDVVTPVTTEDTAASGATASGAAASGAKKSPTKKWSAHGSPFYFSKWGDTRAVSPNGKTRLITSGFQLVLDPERIPENGCECIANYECNEYKTQIFKDHNKGEYYKCYNYKNSTKLQCIWYRYVGNKELLLKF